MISDRSRGINTLVLLSQCILVTAAFWLWFLLCHYPSIAPGAIARHLVYNEIILVGLLLGTRSYPLGVSLQKASFEVISRRSFLQFGTALFYLLIYLVAIHDALISRLFFFTFAPVFLALLLATNRFLPSLLGNFTFRPELRQEVLLVGPRRKALEVKRWLDENKRSLGLEVHGLLTEDQGEAADDSLPTLGRPDDLEKVLAEAGISRVVMVEFPRHNGTMRGYANLCEARAVRLLVIADLDQIFGQPLAIAEDQGLFFIGLREEPLENPINRFFKRCLDIAISLPVVVFILPPLMLAVWIAQKLQSPGSLFFWQAREGFENEAFDILKFRTMHIGAVPDERLPSSKDDPRLYPFGSFLRTTSLDEIPQFWNVLCGKMSVVGPRPHLKVYNDQYREVFFRAYVRSLVKPGITGLAQARGFRGDARTPEEVVGRMQSDIEYLENWSFWLDCWLILRTALQIVIPPKTAV
jgi:putative colanic acid biosynthesis UDP-glucose lipid carrier transferase